MDADKLHLLLNHYPMIVSFLAMTLLVFGLLRKSDKFTRAGLWAFLIVAVVSFPVYVSGEITGGEMGKGMFAEAVNQHKQSARFAFLFVEAVGIASLIGLILLWRKSKKAKWFIYLILILSLASTVIITLTTLKGRAIKSSPNATNTSRITTIHKLTEMEKKLWLA